MSKYDDYLDFAISKVRTANSRYDHVLTILKTNKEIDTLFFRMVIGSFVKEMFLSISHLFERNSSNNMNIHKLLKMYIDNQKDSSKKKKAEKLLGEIKGIQFKKWKTLFEYRNGVIAHSDYEVYQIIKDKPKKFSKAVDNFTEALSKANEIIKLLVSDFEIETKQTKRAMYELDLTLKLIKNHQEYVNFMREQEQLDYQIRHNW